MKIIPERASHWYFQDGRPCHQVQAKSGNGLRDATLRDARTLGLYPSVTSILNIIAKPQLEAWKQEQGIIAALTLPRQRESFEDWSRSFPTVAGGSSLLRWAYDHPPRFTEDEHAFALRVVEDSQAQASEAADFGRRIHKAIEGWLLGAPVVLDKEIESYMENVIEWAGKNVVEIYSAECIVTNQEHGYAGTMDLHCELLGIGEATVDFKSQGVKNGKPTFYDEWFLQLAAYGGAIARTREPNAVKPKLPACVSVVVDSTKPAPVAVKQWEDPERGFFLFRCAFELWCNQKQFNPLEKTK